MLLASLFPVFTVGYVVYLKDNLSGANMEVIFHNIPEIYHSLRITRINQYYTVYNFYFFHGLNFIIQLNNLHSTTLAPILLK